MNGYDRIKQVKADLRKRGIKVNIPDLLALASINDPFYSGSKGNQVCAEWFAGLWDQFGMGDGVHLRKMHYRVISHADPVI